MASNWRSHVNAKAHESVAEEPVLQEVAVGLSDLFEMTWAAVDGHGGATYLQALLRPNRRAQATLMTDREIACLVAPYEDIEIRAVDALEGLIQRHSARVDPRICVLVHFDGSGDNRVRQWGNERDLVLIPVHRSRRTGLPPGDELIQKLAQYLYRHDPFALNEPVASDRDFFGRRSDAERLLRSLASGQVRSLFALRRAGKTSIINRICTLARKSGEADVAMIDAADDAVHGADAATAQRIVTQTVNAARRTQYATAGAAARSDPVPSSSSDLLGELSKVAERPVILIFDEADFVAPYSTASPAWSRHFVPFWRGLRVAYQESRRLELPVGLLVCGVSSRAFREVTVGRDENPVFGFVPEEYLAPFEAQQAGSMIRDLGQRCGLRFSRDACSELNRLCAGFPHWLRLAGSAIHHEVEIEKRPVDIDVGDLERLLKRFLSGEGLDYAAMALSNLADRDPEVLTGAQQARATGGEDTRSARLAARYGLGWSRTTVTRGPGTDLIGLALQRLEVNAPPQEPPKEDGRNDALVVSEIALLHDRLERDLRTLIRGTLQATGTEDWAGDLLQALTPGRRDELADHRGADLMVKLYFLELRQVVMKHWRHFEKRFGNKKRFSDAMDIANDRPHAHAKDFDLADLALFRREYRWLQERTDA
jgi:hypothetical protein